MAVRFFNPKFAEDFSDFNRGEVTGQAEYFLSLPPEDLVDTAVAFLNGEGDGQWTHGIITALNQRGMGDLASQITDAANSGNLTHGIGDINHKASMGNAIGSFFTDAALPMAVGAYGTYTGANFLGGNTAPGFFEAVGDSFGGAPTAGAGAHVGPDGFPVPEGAQAFPANVSTYNPAEYMTPLDAAGNIIGEPISMLPPTGLNTPPPGPATPPPTTTPPATPPPGGSTPPPPPGDAGIIKKVLTGAGLSGDLVDNIMTGLGIAGTLYYGDQISDIDSGGFDASVYTDKIDPIPRTQGLDVSSLGFRDVEYTPRYAGQTPENYIHPSMLGQVGQPVPPAFPAAPDQGPDLSPMQLAQLHDVLRGQNMGEPQTQDISEILRGNGLRPYPPLRFIE